MASGSQLVPARARTHAAIAAGLQETEGERVDESAALIAQHYERAKDSLSAARWHFRAAGWSAVRDPSAAADHAERVRELGPELPADPEVAQMQIGARALILSVGWRLGRDPTELIAVFDEGERLAAELGQ